MIFPHLPNTKPPPDPSQRSFTCPGDPAAAHLCPGEPGSSLPAAPASSSLLSASPGRSKLPKPPRKHHPCTHHLLQFTIFLPQNPPATSCIETTISIFFSLPPPQKIYFLTFIATIEFLSIGFPYRPLHVGTPPPQLPTPPGCKTQRCLPSASFSAPPRS